MLESRQCILHLPVSPRSCFAIVGFGLLFTILFCLTFPEGVDPLPYDHLARAISFRLSQSQQHCPKQTSHSGHSAAPQWQLPNPQETDLGIYTLENGCLVESNLKVRWFGMINFNLEMARMR